jgi:hypothetical protein
VFVAESSYLLHLLLIRFTEPFPGNAVAITVLGEIDVISAQTGLPFKPGLRTRAVVYTNSLWDLLNGATDQFRWLLHFVV